MTQPAPPSWGRPQPHQQPTAVDQHGWSRYEQPRYEQPRYDQPQYAPAWPVAYAVQPVQPVQAEHGAYRYVALACGTLLVIGALVLAGVLLLPRTSPVVVASGSSSPVVAPVAVPSSDVVVPAGGYSCGSASGHSVVVENGTVPCDHARSVASQWLTTGTTPGDGEGSAGTMYSWTCSTTSAGGGWCTSKMGSHLGIG